MTSKSSLVRLSSTTHGITASMYWMVELSQITPPRSPMACTMACLRSRRRAPHSGAS